MGEVISLVGVSWSEWWPAERGRGMADVSDRE